MVDVDDAQTLEGLLRTAVWELVYGAGESALPAIERLRAKGATLSAKRCVRVTCDSCAMQVWVDAEGVTSARRILNVDSPRWQCDGMRDLCPDCS